MSTSNICEINRLYFKYRLLNHSPFNQWSISSLSSERIFAAELKSGALPQNNFNSQKATNQNTLRAKERETSFLENVTDIELQ